MKAVKFKILKPINTDWKTLGNMLRDIQYQTAKALNHCMTQRHLWQSEKERWKIANGRYPTFKELPPPENRLYSEVRAMFPDLQSKSVSEIVRKSKLRWKTDCKDCYYKLGKSLPTFRKTHPILVSGQQYKLIQGNDGYVVSIGFRPKEHKVKPFQIQLATKKLSPSQKSILNKLFNGTYKKSSLQICYNQQKKNWYAVFVYQPESQVKKLDPDKIIGVDLGIVQTFYCAVSDSKDRIHAPGDEISKFRDKIRYMRKSFQRGYKTSTRRGRGRNNALNPVLSIGSKERRFRDTKYHCYTKAIIDFALKHNAGVIQIENLDGLKSVKVDNFILKDWAIADFHEKLKYKAVEYGIEVRFINPQYTSQRCSECGFISKENRISQEFFKCRNPECGYEINADYNAARNLAIPFIDQIIKVQIASSDGELKDHDPLAN